ncbi:putative protease inhibitor [Hypomontagnella submonticulosa]|nr:putative protease inhibitor [Hypomontagnella submonticulosa]
MPTSKSANAALSLIKDDKSKVLGLTVGKHANVQPGDYIPKADATSEPELSFASLSPDKTYLVIGIDLDAPFPSFAFLGPILHWIQPGLKTSEEGGVSLKSADPFIANYAAPGPPPGSSPHRYVFLLYEQPEGFDGKKYAPPNGKNLGIGGRMRWNLDAWEKDAKLGPVLAVNYFTSN